MREYDFSVIACVIATILVRIDNDCNVISFVDRGTMEKFWRKHSTECNEKEMMLDYNAESIGRREIPEILALLPNIRGKVVLELGAGIGWVNLLGACTLSICRRGGNTW